MRIDKLWIKDFKNLKNFEINFDEEQLTTVLIGHNGTGKSNLIEAIVIIFRNLDLGKPPEFSYDLTYYCRNNRIQIKAEADKKLNHTEVTVNGKNISFSKFVKFSDRRYLPNYVFAYYSGHSNRLESHFDVHQKNFYKDLLQNKEKPLRPLFYTRLIHSQFVLLSYFSFSDEKSREFLKKYLDIAGLESVLFILKKPPWKSKDGDKRFWNARGVVQGFLSILYNQALAPLYKTERISMGYNKKRNQDHLYLFIPNGETLKNIAQIYGNNREFFKVLESTYISDLIYEVQIKVKKINSNDTIMFKELSEGEQQLLTVLGLLKFTKDEESLFLLDEPDTHLNPAWKLGYLNLLEEVVGKQETSHILICTHDPLLIGGLLRNQVQIFKKSGSTGQIIATPPEYDPRGMGVAALLTSELFGLSTTLDLETQKKLDRKRELYLKSLESELIHEENEEMRMLSAELGSLDFTRTIRDPLYDKFVRAIMSRDDFKKPVLTPAERRKQEKIAQEIINEILAEEKQ